MRVSQVPGKLRMNKGKEYGEPASPLGELNVGDIGRRSRRQAPPRIQTRQWAGRPLRSGAPVGRHAEAGGSLCSPSTSFGYSAQSDRRVDSLKMAIETFTIGSRLRR